MAIKFVNDGSGKAPRKVQLDVFRWLEVNWDKSDVFVLKMPVASGKSFVARAIQIATDADVITPNNILVSQYSSEYSDVNFLKGKTHYACPTWGVSCADAAEFNKVAGIKNGACADCPYAACNAKAHAGHPTFFNPMSYWMLDSERITPIIVDEAHLLPSMLSMLSGRKFGSNVYDIPKHLPTDFDAVGWMKSMGMRLDRAIIEYSREAVKATSPAKRKAAAEKATKYKEDAQNIRNTIAGYMENPQNYAKWVSKEGDERFLHIKPIYVPKFVSNKFFKGRKVVLMSGTLFDHDVRNLVGDRPTMTFECESPIPVANRRIVHTPVSFKMNFATDMKLVADAILKTLEVYKGNAIVHLSYSWVDKIRPYLPEHFHYIASDSKDQKQKVLETFFREGGTLIAGGCAEGVDLKGDLCRVNIIPKMMYPDLKDPVITKRMTKPDGETWYALETFKTIIQQTGRSTRTEDDTSTIVILDPNLNWQVSKFKKYLPKYFVEAIKWMPTLK